MVEVISIYAFYASTTNGLSFRCRVLTLEKKKETVKEKDVASVTRTLTINNKADSDDDDDDDDVNFDEYIDWRAKKSYKKANKQF